MAESSSKAEASNSALTASQRLEAIKQEELELQAKLNLKKQQLQDELKTELETAIKKVAAAYKNCVECGASNVWANENIQRLLLELGLTDGTGFIKESEIGTEAFLTKYNLKRKKAPRNSSSATNKEPMPAEGASGESPANFEASCNAGLTTNPVAESVQ